jgi:hypothetical protein
MISVWWMLFIPVALIVGSWLGYLGYYGRP